MGHRSSGINLYHAPNEIAKPVVSDDAIDSDGIRKITVTKPDESNGLLSCLFIIVKDGSYERNINFSMENLIKAQSSTTEYIAVALPVFKFEKVINLGDELESFCSVTQTIDIVSKKRRRRRSVSENTSIAGKNRKLDKEKTYSVFVVSTTPCGNDICMQTSPPTPFRNANAFQSWIIAVIVAGACLLIALLIMVVVIKRRKAKSISSKIDSVDEVIPTRPDSASKFQNEEATTGGYAEVGFTATNKNTSSTSNFQNEEESTDGYTKMAFAGTAKNATTTKKSNSKIQTKPNTPSAPRTQINAEEDLGPYINITAKFKFSKSSDTAISTSDLEEVYNSMRKKENSQFLDQFQKILSEAAKLGEPKKFASNPDLKKKNRYKNILPFDETRVKISPEGSGYINACYIDGHNKRRKYIATQGPLATTVNDFWQMIIEHKCYLIVMLTKEKEAGKKKCEKYWPDENKNQEFGSVLVENVHEVNYGSFIKRSFTVKSRNKGLDVTLNVYQYQFLKWPDHGAPATTSDLLRMHRAVMENYEEIGKGSPIVVHCSAGAGRTGTLIGFDILLDESKSVGSIDAFACVLNMRKQRVEMVQNSDQYVLVHKLVLEAILIEGRDLSSDEAKAKLEKIKTPDGEASIKKEFEDLNRIGPMKDSKLRGLDGKNKKMNRSKKSIPYDYTLVTIFMQQDEDEIPYMNASWVESNDESSPMIASQGPTSSNIDLFWRLILDNNVNTIVMLTKLKEGKEEQCAQYWPTNVGEVMKWNNLSVTRINEETKAPITEREIRVERGSQSKTVTQFHYIGWKSTSCPEDGRELIDLVSKMQKNIRSAGNGVTLIHCSDGIGRTGVFCATVNLIDRLKCENRIDVFRAVKDLRDGRPNMVENLDQYKFCYQAIVEYLKSFDLYSNF
ncbi:receptor-type tyrosine-protein phosphatase epsilon-like [Styela clava]